MSGIPEYALGLTHWQKNILLWNFRMKIQGLLRISESFLRLAFLHNVNPVPESQEMVQKVRSYNE